ncbi:type-F conjugative transfer system protein TraW [Legionella qingyii]|uniref:Type-F conjugative transfer system protein TraW n=1 Tax=Legionella qingyii TaxID=2184757 RepID=A0A317TWS7_9GAMM|nr:type-F conjugative transfer system protein TraW [Legionella qingyii]PWY53813.1 type-F conjugative transfer system protein TraW [Legionella qingyii]RUR24147.1 type-F conjugative transfer system protein TraW [Legionella qingyii]
MKKVMLVSLMITIYWNAHAKSFGVVGEVFPVAEKSFLVLIEKRLRTLTTSGELEALNRKWIDTVVNHTNRPTALGLERINKTIRHYYTSEITLNKDITDHKGKVLFPKGTYVNALEHMPAYRPCWLFFNADDEAQIRWAQLQKSKCPNPKFILTGGAIKRTEKSLNAVIYFDQEGRITRKLNIEHVPARVTRKENQLLIVEVAIKENGNAL